MELGDTASAFEYESYQENEMRCFRYYEKRVTTAILYGSNATVGGSSDSTFISYANWQFKVRKRAAPTCTGSTGTQQQLNVDSASVYRAGNYPSWADSSTASSEL